MNGVEYEVTLYQGEHSNEYLLCEMKDGKVEGRCQLFNRGILSLAWKMKNGKRVGGITEYKNGKALQKESWNSILGNGGDRRRIENKKGEMKLIISHQAGIDNEEIVIYQGGFDEEMNRDGYGIEYNVENGREKIEGYWSKDILIRMIREFDADNNEMIEYAESNGENGNVEILNRVPMYIGGYSIENGKFVRNGVGYLLDEANGTATRESEWEHGIEKKGGVDLYEGWYVSGMKESIRHILKNKKPSEIKSEVVEAIPDKLIRVRNTKELNTIDSKVTDLVICSKSGNDARLLDLNQFKCLQSIEIQDECFTSVKTFNINGLKRLKKLKIGNDSFTRSAGTFGNDESKSFHILNCESLESIEIGEYSFSDFAGNFELKNLPQLRSIKIGHAERGWNFAYSSFVVKGLFYISADSPLRSSKSAID